jgi:hypothetical protein
MQLSKKGLQVIAYNVSEYAASRAIEVYVNHKHTTGAFKNHQLNIRNATSL